MNVLVINLKGGAAKTTNASLIASFLPTTNKEQNLLIEIDKINESDSKIKSKDYKSVQVDFLNESDQSFLEFENYLLDEGVKIIDVGAVKLEIFHKSMTAANLYSTIDLLIIPSMDGSDDMLVAMSFLQTIRDVITPDRIMFSFNRFNDHEYTSHEEQFSSFFDKKSEIKKNFGIDLSNEDNYYILKDSRAIKLSRAKKCTLKSLVDTDADAITAAQRAEKDRVKRLELTRQRSLILSSQNFYNDYVINMIEKIMFKLQKSSK
ncbi:hypothetical protein [Sulfurimonas sp.]|jgi:cellulose biosynthesis protein BcsQ|uniref:hypothetical protein n=1 Tax=Sulfurimonas sp. TaxID=2022749 RepID=UPI002A3677A1|nr:hypothetical protein [Sulfurimonas sp.]MDY0122843.1 hypothetical protein [Sulfurimonas sp.]